MLPLTDVRVYVIGSPALRAGRLVPEWARE